MSTLPNLSWLRWAILPLTRIHVPVVSAKLAELVEGRQGTHGNMRVRVRGLEWDLDLSEQIDLKVFYLGTHERFTTARLLRLVRPGDVVFDVGANIGYFTLLAAREVGAAGNVYAFEPMRHAHDRLAEHVRLNSLANVRAEKSAVGATPAEGIEVSFRSSYRVFDDEARPVSTGTERVPMTTIDEYVERHGISRIDLMKVDTDGFEFEVIAGAHRTLERLRPTLIIEIGREATSPASGAGPRELLQKLASCGYEFYAERTMRRLAGINQVVESLPPGPLTTNVVCVHPESSAAVRAESSGALREFARAFAPSTSPFGSRSR